MLTPERGGLLDRDGVRIHYEVYGAGPGAILLMPSWALVHSGIWKHQILYLSRHFRVIAFDPRGNGRSDRPRGPDAYRDVCYVEDARAVLEAAGVRRAVIVALSRGTAWAVAFGARYPERTAGLVLIGGSTPDRPSHAGRAARTFRDEPTDDAGWATLNLHHLRRDYDRFVDFFVQRVFPEPHSSKAIEDVRAWAHEIGPERLIDTVIGATLVEPGTDPLAPYRALRCPVQVLHGDADEVAPLACGERLARLTRGDLLVLRGSGHAPQARDPVPVNRAIHAFADRVLPAREPRRRALARGPDRPRRVLFLSSPIGLGHARRDLAIANELRRLRPDIRIDWLAQSPVTAVLEAAGERIHPASRQLLSESGHLEARAGEHELHVFQAFRAMDRILVTNFLVFQEAVEGGQYDLVVSDEAWEVDQFWHDHPELKRCAFAWLTDFVGFLPVPDADDREHALTADYNAEMIERVARYPRVRDLSIFIGEPDDVVTDCFGPDLPAIRDWTERHFRFSGYIPGFDPDHLGDRSALRDALGYAPGEPVCILAVGGSGVGRPLLHRLVEALPAVRDRLPDLRLIAVAGPRIDPRTLPTHPGLDVRSYVHDLYRHLAAADLALVQGGLSTTMELTTLKRPFVYFPVRNHFEQLRHVRHRLDRYGAGRAMAYDDATPDVVADTIATEIGRSVTCRDVPREGATRAAGWISELL